MKFDGHTNNNKSKENIMGRTFKFICTEPKLFSALQKAFGKEASSEKVEYQRESGTKLEFNFVSALTAAAILALPEKLAEKHYVARLYLNDMVGDKVSAEVHYLDGSYSFQRDLLSFILTGRCEKEAVIHSQAFSQERQRTVLPPLKPKIKHDTKVQRLKEDIQHFAKQVEIHIKNLEAGYSMDDLDYVIMRSGAEGIKERVEKHLEKDESLIASLNVLMSKIIVCENLLAERVEKAHKKQSKDLAYAILPRLKKQQESRWEDIAIGGKAQTGSPLLPTVQRQMLTQADSPGIAERSPRMPLKKPIDSPVFSARSEQSPASRRRQVPSKPLAVASLVVTSSSVFPRSPRGLARMPLSPLNSPVLGVSDGSTRRPPSPSL
jgi:hypothetical protein